MQDVTCDNWMLPRTLAPSGDLIKCARKPSSRLEPNTRTHTLWQHSALSRLRQCVFHLVFGMRHTRSARHTTHTHKHTRKTRTCECNCTIISISPTHHKQTSTPHTVRTIFKPPWTFMMCGLVPRLDGCLNYLCVCTLWSLVVFQNCVYRENERACNATSAGNNVWMITKSHTHERTRRNQRRY